MLLGSGIDLIEPKDHQAGLMSLQPLIYRHDARVYSVDTFWQGPLSNSYDLVRAILDSMQVWDWYGYRLNVALSQCLTAPDIRIHVVAVALDPGSQHILSDIKLMKILEQVHKQAQHLGKQFRTVFFKAPLATPTPRL